MNKHVDKNPRHTVSQLVINAATEVGRDSRGRGGLFGYFQFLATEHPKEFVKLLGPSLREYRPPEQKGFETAFELLERMKEIGLVLFDGYRIEFDGTTYTNLQTAIDAARVKKHIRAGQVKILTPTGACFFETLQKKIFLDLLPGELNPDFIQK